MKQAIMVHPGEIEIHGAPAPTPGQAEVLLRVQRIGVCGSDIHVYHGKHPLTSYPVVQGHEFSAVLEAYHFIDRFGDKSMKVVIDVA